MRVSSWLLGLIAAACFACGSHSGGNTDGGGGGGGGDDGGGGSTVDAPPYGGQCTPGGSVECSDCIDNDGDGKKDGFDPECTGPLDDREDSFATGIPGDNIDATDQDCFFDGNSGAGNDGCNQHVCCLLQAGGATADTSDDQTECHRLAPNANASKYVRSQCYKPFGTVNVPTKCQMNCGPLAPPGCDCFGCCTVCQTASDPTSCRDIALNPQISPNCNDMNIIDPGPDGVDNTGDEPCRRCFKADCGNTECGGTTCILCPGQDPNMTPLPPECGGSSTCPQGIMECAADGSCPMGTYCQTGCCVGVIQ